MLHTAEAKPPCLANSSFVGCGLFCAMVPAKSLVIGKMSFICFACQTCPSLITHERMSGILVAVAIITLSAPIFYMSPKRSSISC